MTGTSTGDGRPFAPADALVAARARAVQLAEELFAAADEAPTAAAAGTGEDRWLAFAEYIHP